MTNNVFIIGATGFVGGGIARHLAANGKGVIGLARNPDVCRRLGAVGVAAATGDVERDINAVIATARSHDAIIYAAQVAPSAELNAVSTLVEMLAGSGKTLIFLSGSGVLCQRTAGAWSEATEIWGEFDALIMSVSSRVRDTATRTSLGWAPHHTDMLPEIGEPRLRALAPPIQARSEGP